MYRHITYLLVVVIFAVNAQYTPSFEAQRPQQPPAIPTGAPCPAVSFTHRVIAESNLYHRFVFDVQSDNDVMWVDLHYAKHGGELVNIRMTKTDANTFEAAGVIVNYGESLTYFFTYCAVPGIDCNTALYSFTSQPPPVVTAPPTRPTYYTSPPPPVTSSPPPQPVRYGPVPAVLTAPAVTGFTPVGPAVAVQAAPVMHTHGHWMMPNLFNPMMMPLMPLA